MNGKLIFGIINTALYPLLIYVLMPLYSRSIEIGSTDAAGAGMARGFIYIRSTIICSILVFIISLIAAHKMVHAWWIGLLSLVLGLSFSLIGYQLASLYESEKLTYYCEYYYNTEQLEEEGYYKGHGAMNKHGKIKKYRQDGSVETIETFKNGAINGRCEFFYPDGTVKATGEKTATTQYDTEGVFDGKWSYFNTDGALNDERTYRKGELVASKNYTLFYDSTKTICSIADKKPYAGTLEKVGVVNPEVLFPNLISGTLIDGQYDGAYHEYYYIDGEVRPAVTTTFDKGKIEGSMIRYHENGQLRDSCSFHSGKREGVYIRYYADTIATRPHGAVEFTCSYSDGKIQGTARWLYPSGETDTTTEYVDGIKHGLNVHYNEDGTIWARCNYRNDEQEGEYEENRDTYSEKGRYEKGEKIYIERYSAEGVLESIQEHKDDGWVQSFPAEEENGSL